MSTAQVITLGLAVWGAVVSTTLAAMQILHRRKSIKVRLYYPWDSEFDNLMPATGMGDDRCIVLVAANEGVRPIHIIDAGFDLANGLSIPEPKSSKPELPATLSAGDAVVISFPFPPPAVAKRFQHMYSRAEYAWVREASGRKFRTAFQGEPAVRAGT